MSKQTIKGELRITRNIGGVETTGLIPIDSLTLHTILRQKMQPKIEDKCEWIMRNRMVLDEVLSLLLRRSVCPQHERIHIYELDWDIPSSTAKWYLSEILDYIDDIDETIVEYTYLELAEEDDAR